MEIISAGMSLDNDYIERARKGELKENEIVTPETLSSAYASISRDPRPVNELRDEAIKKVKKARGMNKRIVFGMGHHSVAEHIALNFDVLGISRLAIEALEERRLCSYTEKSQRYITLDGDFVTPAEFQGAERELFLDTNQKQLDLYFKAFPVLHELQKKRHPEMAEGSAKEKATVEGYAKEDARYALNMATEGQLGLTANARNLEYIIRKLRHSPLAEVRELSEKLFEIGSKVAPSLIILSDPEEFAKALPDAEPVSDDFMRTLKGNLEGMVDGLLEVYTPAADDAIGTSGDVTLIDHTSDPDAKIIGALIHTAADRSLSYAKCLNIATQMGPEGRLSFVKDLLEKKTKFDAVPREFEYAQFLIEAVVSSSEFAQWKRHRMMTITKQAYDPELGYTYPEAVIEAGLKDDYERLFDETTEAFYQLIRNNPEAADYMLTNAHKRRILMGVNLRELYAIATLRMDSHAQWEIRETAGQIMELVRPRAPATALLATGKHLFQGLHDEVYSTED